MKTLMIALTPLLLATATTAAAEPLSARPASLSAAGLDLATSQGAAALLKRAAEAAEKACGIDAKWDRWSDDYRRCRTATIAALVAKIDAPVVTALHRGEPLPVQVAAAK